MPGVSVDNVPRGWAGSASRTSCHELGEADRWPSRQGEDVTGHAASSPAAMAVQGAHPRVVLRVGRRPPPARPIGLLERLVVVADRLARGRRQHPSRLWSSTSPLVPSGRRSPARGSRVRSLPTRRRRRRPRLRVFARRRERGAAGVRPEAASRAATRRPSAPVEPVTARVGNSVRIVPGRSEDRDPVISRTPVSR